MKSKLFLTLMLLLSVAGWARADELTIYEEATGNSSYVPVYGTWADSYLKCEFVIPADELADMANGTISQMKFYLSSAPAEAWTGTFQVFLKEVSEATISEYSGTVGATVVYEGTLDATSGTMDVVFTDDYTYEGGNLLVGVYQIEKGNWKGATFTGQTVTGASVQGYSSSSLDAISANQRNFIPKTTFTYTTGEAPSCVKPKGLTVNYTGDTTAEVSWTSDADAWIISVNDTETATTENPYTLTDLDLATTYEIKVRTDCGGGDLSDWTSPVSFTTDFCLEDDQCVINIELTDAYSDGGGSIKVVDAETSMVLGTFTCSGASSAYTLSVCPGREINFVFAATDNYAYENGWVITDVNNEIISEHVGCTSSSDCTAPTNGVIATYLVDCTIATCPQPTELAVNYEGDDTAEVSWTSEADSFDLMVNDELIEGVTNPYTLENLELSTNYEVKVRANCGGGDYSSWTPAVSFKTNDCMNVDMCYITYELHAKQYNGSYQYGWYGAYLMVYDDDTDELIDYWTVPQNDADGTVTGSLSLCQGKALRFEWYSQSSGNDALLVGDITVLDFNGDEIISCTGALTEAVSYEVDCIISDFKKPTDLTASSIGPESAVLSWTENGEATSWILAYKRAADTNFTEIRTDENPYTLTDLRAETEYNVKVRPDGDNEKWSAVLSFTTTVSCPTPTDIEVTPSVTTADVSWTGFGENYNVRYREVLFYDGFENGMDQWTTVRNGGGTTSTDWKAYDPSLFSNPLPAHSGDYVAMSRSWASSAYSVENWLISPEVELGGTLSYWVMDDGEYHEHYDVYISTRDNDIENFTLLYEPGNASDTWTQHTVDLSAYAGRTGYIAFVNTDNDKDFLFIDDVTITSANARWITVSTEETSIELTDLTPETIYELQVQAEKGREESEWSESVAFTTLSDNPVPYDIVADLNAEGAALSWTGTGDSYNLKYRTASSAELFLFEDFENGAGSWTTSNLQSGGGALQGAGLDNGIGFGFKYTSTPPQYLISPKLSGVEEGATLRFYYRNYSTDYGVESFKVGYSTSTNEVDDFTWTEEMSVAEDDNWHLYEQTLPEGVNYISIQCTSNNVLYFLVDNIGIYGDSTTPAGEWVTVSTNDPAYTLSGLATNNAYEYQIQSVKNGNASEWSEMENFALLTLANDASNYNLLANNAGRLAHVTLADRTLFKDGTWNTLCLPFDIDEEDSFMNGATAKTLSDASISGTSVTLSFSEYPVYAGYPYIIKWVNGNNIENPEFANVTISALNGYTLGTDNVKFIGYFNPFEITPEDEGIYYMKADNTLAHTGKNRTLKAFRAYFEFTEEALEGARSIVLDLGDGNQATSISSLPADMLGEGDWYTVSGMKVNTLKKGVYINNGKKVVIK